MVRWQSRFHNHQKSQDMVHVSGYVIKSQNKFKILNRNLFQSIVYSHQLKLFIGHAYDVGASPTPDSAFDLMGFN